MEILNVMAKDRDTVDIDIVHIPVSWYIIEVLLMYFYADFTEICS